MSKNKSDQLKRRSAREAQMLLRGVTRPSHIGCVQYDSRDWQNMMESPNGKAWERGKGIVKGYLKPDNSDPFYGTFPGMSEGAVRDLFYSFCLDDDIRDVEQKYYDKFGTYRAPGYAQWAGNVHSLWKTTTYDPDLQLLEACKNRLKNDLAAAIHQTLGTDFIEALPIEKGLERTTKGRNSGWPFFSRKWYTNPEMLGYYTSAAKQLLKGKDTLNGMPHILFKRTAPNGPSPKVRPVEGPPKHDAIAGKCVTDQFITVFKTMRQFSGFNGGHTIHTVIPQFRQYDVWVESDFSAFDQNCQEMMVHVLDVVRDLIDPTLHAYLDVVQNYYQHGLLITPEGLLYGKDGKINGLFSGDAWTSVIGTLANAIANYYALTKMGVTDYVILSFGDDVAIACNRFDALEYSEYMKELGMECNPSKQYVTSGDRARVSFLGYYHFKHRPDCTGVFPIMRSAPGLYYRESWADLKKIAEMAGLTELEIEELGKFDPIGVDLMAFASKLANLSEQYTFVEVVEMFREHAPRKMDTRLIYPFENLRKARLQGRYTRGSVLADTPIMQVLMDLEDLDENF